MANCPDCGEPCMPAAMGRFDCGADHCPMYYFEDPNNTAWRGTDKTYHEASCDNWGGGGCGCQAKTAP